MSRGLLTFLAVLTAVCTTAGVGFFFTAEQAQADARQTQTAAQAQGSGYERGAPIASDDFNRSTHDGWGSAKLGGTYGYSASRYFSAQGQTAVASPPRPGSSLTATLGAVAAFDAVASLTSSVRELPTAGNGIYSGLQLRSAAGSFYQANVRITPAGEVLLNLHRINGSTVTQTSLVRERPVLKGFTPGSALHLDFQATGANPVILSARVWADAAPAPDWQVRFEDASPSRLAHAGAIGIWTYASSGSTPVPVSYDSFSASTLVPSSAKHGSDGTGAVGEPSPTPAPSPSPPATSAPQPPAGVGHADPAPGGSTVGAPAVGSSAYPVPAGALFVATTGSDGGDGSQRAPFATLGRAIALARSGSTIVVRAGSYHESLVIPSAKKLTIQPYPHETVWLDGSRTVSGWQRSGAAWVASGWTVRFDSSPTYSRGKPDGTQPGWAFLDSHYPMAAHPDQLWLGGTALSQVGSLASLRPGTFFVDSAGSRLYLGSDPSGKTVRASDTVKALTIAGEGSTLRGIGVRRYAPSVPDMGAVSIAAPGVSLRDVVIEDSATTGLAVFASGAHITDVTIARSGMLGAQASYADGLRIDGLLSVDNNTEHFNRAPVSGGVKIHKSRGVSVTNSTVRNNLGNGLWFDESVYGITATGNDILDNTGNGLVLELSATATVANNVIARNSLDGILISDTGQVQVWNNTLSGNSRSVNITQGDRRASNLSTPGHDARQKLPDPTVTWITGNISVNNNVFAGGTGKCVLCVEDYSHERSAQQMHVTANGNVYQRVDAAHPNWAVVWSRGTGNPAVYTSVSEFSKATGQEKNNVAVDGAAVLRGLSTLTSRVTSEVQRVARPLPAAIGKVVGESSGAQHLGAWR
ncbi:right-handed parallel beta-helix repeat-containing protein [Parafrigoribacterium soli]|uniref:right-handed parallel beta-helix repeat-containing protein n=1 Tax=Parafrigoribacterium soli TaxID=3144663 RepID=UPI0032EA90FC